MTSDRRTSMSREYFRDYGNEPYDANNRRHIKAMSEDSDLDKFTREWVVRAGDINMRSRHAAFRSLLAIAVALEPITYKMLTKPEAQAKPLMEKRWASI